MEGEYHTTAVHGMRGGMHLCVAEVLIELVVRCVRWVQPHRGIPRTLAHLLARRCSEQGYRKAVDVRPIDLHVKRTTVITVQGSGEALLPYE